MTFDQMPDSTKAAFASLPNEAKAHLLALANNKFQVIVPRADEIVDGTAKDPIASAGTIARMSRQFERDLNSLFKPTPNAHLGANKE